ncbi:hypothetical protein QIS74_04942 [Colletotrichum tabaci]|uniref:Uncharacterized protein n=1 Tax=Colletotrichum tabaci TaxID=1209068 RepID=A0AAV9TK55_9PEZI
MCWTTWLTRRARTNTNPAIPQRDGSPLEQFPTPGPSEIVTVA